MLDLAIASDLAVRATRLTAGSARPDAPVVPHHERVPRTIRVRARVAIQLHRVAAALEPRRDARPACQ
jgi:hypothetical protein